MKLILLALLSFCLLYYMAKIAAIGNTQLQVYDMNGKLLIATKGIKNTETINFKGVHQVY